MTIYCAPSGHIYMINNNANQNPAECD